MNKAMYNNSIEKLATIPQASNRYKLGRQKLVEIASNEGAIRRFGRAVRIDIEVMDTAIKSY